MEILRGMRKLERGGCVHRDIKPENVLVFGDPSDPETLHAKLGDFGIAWGRLGGGGFGRFCVLCPSEAQSEERVFLLTFAGARPLKAWTWTITGSAGFRRGSGFRRSIEQARGLGAPPQPGADAVGPTVADVGRRSSGLVLRAPCRADPRGGSQGVACDLEDCEKGKRGMLGSPPYMAPEVWRGRGHRLNSDVWSAGILAFELFVGRLPVALDPTNWDIPDCRAQMWRHPFRRFVPSPSFDITSDPGFLLLRNEDPQLAALLRQMLRKRVPWGAWPSGEGRSARCACAE